MPRSGDIYSPPAGTKGTPNTTIQSSKYNALIDDLTADANEARPISAGGTGATNATVARNNLGLPTGTIGHVLGFLDAANTWSVAQTFTANNGLQLLSASPTILLTDSDTGAIASISGNSANGSLTIAADTGSTIGGSTIRFTIDGQLAAILDLTGFSLSGTSSVPISSGGTGAITAAAARTNLGLGALATLGSVNNNNWVGADLALENGGTGASTAADARTNLNAAAQDVTITAGNGLKGGGSLAANRTVDINLTGLPSVATLSAPRAVVTDGATAGSEARMTAADFRTTFGFGSLSTLSAINDANWSGTDLSVANGGTGASTAAAARTNLELGPLATLDRTDLVYAGNNSANLDFPIGTVLWVFNPGATPNRNASMAIYLRSGDPAKYSTDVSGTALTGTWRSRGSGDGNSFNLFERTA